MCAERRVVLPNDPVRCVGVREKPMTIHLDGVRMNAITTAPGGVVNASTIFEFHERGFEVWAEYSGGMIARGFLVGTRDGASLSFRYCQRQTDGVLDGGASTCEIRRRDALIQVVERFTWASRDGSGENVLQELPEQDARPQS